MSARRVRTMLFVVLVAALASVGAWFLSRGAPAEPAAGLAVLGVRPGMSRAEVEAVLGPPDQVEWDGEVAISRYGPPEAPNHPERRQRWAQVTFSRQGVATDVMGTHLLRDGREVLAVGTPASEVEAVLGPADEELVKGLYTYPRFSNLMVVALGGTVTQVWMSYRQGPPAANPPPEADLDPPSSSLQGGPNLLGARAGMSRQEVEGLLGPGQIVDQVHGMETTAYGRYQGRNDPSSDARWLSITWDRDGRAMTLRGSHLYERGKVLLARGQSASRLRDLFGEPDVELPQDGAQFWLWSETGLGAVHAGGVIRSLYLQVDTE